MTPSNEHLPGSTSFKPGDSVRWFASQMNWPIQENNVVVEGNDNKYFELAAQLYAEKNDRNLLAQVAIFPTGDGDRGGTLGILNHFPTLRQLINLDMTTEGRRLFRAIVLLDSDSAGKRARTGLTAKHTTFRENRDVFLLQRKLPRTTRDPVELSKLIARENDGWKTLDCEIEDLLSLELLQVFVENTGKPLCRNPIFVNGGHHFEFQAGVKSELFRFVKENAVLKDMELIIEVLKSLRFYLGLDPDGE